MSTVEPVRRRRLLGVDLPRVHDRTFLGAATAVVIAIIALSLPSYPLLTQFRTEALQAIPNVLAPLVILALFIERGVEVVLAGWRAAGATTRDTEMRMAIREGTTDEQWRAKASLDAYTAHSQRLAFLIAFIIALLISMMGVRAIEMLVGDNLVASAPPFQRNLFVRVDILVTALLLTGGAEGIHKIVNAFTTFMESTKQKLKEG